MIGFTTGERLDHFIHDIVSTSYGKDDIMMSPPVAEAMKKLRAFMFERVYKNKEAKSEEGKAEMLVQTLYSYYRHHLELLSEDMIGLINRGEPEERVVCDYICLLYTSSRNAIGNGGNIAILILFGLAALIGLAGHGNYSDLVIWSFWCLLNAILAVIAMVKNR